MKPERIKTKTLIAISVAMLILSNTGAYVVLLYKNKDWNKTTILERRLYGSDSSEDDVSVVAEALIEHVYYDGDSITKNQTLNHYDNSEQMTGVEKIEEVLQGDKVVMLLSINSCSSCAKDEMNKLLELSKKIGRNRLVIVADYAMHSHKEMSMCFDKEGYYETDVEHFGLEGSPTRETPVVMLIQNGRVKTSFSVGQQTKEFAEIFHNYLLNYFTKKR